MKKLRMPQVAIVGRTNVGKSTLFNRLSDSIKSIAFDEHGVTRDLIKETITWQGRLFDLVDTGGVSVKKTTDPIVQQTYDRAYSAMQEADVIIFMCDGVVGPTDPDREISRFVHRLGKKVILVINKIDDKRSQEHMHEFTRLGHATIVGISAQHGKGIDDLLEEIVINLGAPKTEEQEPQAAFKVVVLGKPNVGKSSLVNLLLKQERFIVADQPGTTREAIGELVRFCQEDILVTDTPGIRRKRSVNEPLEELMVKSSFHAVQEADIIMLMIDASEGAIVDQELKLAFYVFSEQAKALLVLFNKNDAVDELNKADLKFSLEPYEHLMSKLPALSISCKTGKNVGKVMPSIEKLWHRYSQQFASDELTRLLKGALEKKPLYKNQQLLRIINARQIKSAPPTILLRVSQSHLFGDSQRAFFEGIMRDTYELQGVPIRFIVRTAE